MSKVDGTDIDAEIAASIKKFSQKARSEHLREDASVPDIIEMPEFVRQKAQLISAHFLLPAGARIADMGCEKGEISYMLAALNPRSEIIGIDSDPGAIDFARRTYQLPNLSYVLDDISIPGIADDSLDGIVNSNILHHIYSIGGYDPSGVAELLDKQVRKLKAGGTMLVRDFVMPPEGEFVMLELPDVKSRGHDPESLSDADLLVAFSQGARPIATGAEGFYIEELPSMNEASRLFRLPHKWALEFIHRKNYRANWAREMKEEYTFFTLNDYRREFMRLGMRMVYSGPYWNPWVVKNCFKGRFRLYDAAGEALDYPSTNHFIVAQKVADKQSLVLEERRPSTAPVGDLQIMVVRDKKTGVLHEMVKRPGEHCDIVPWRMTPDNRIVMYVRGGYPRPIVNAVQRGAHNLDGKKWSGHLIEPISMDTAEMTESLDDNRDMLFGHVSAYAGLRPKSKESWYLGDTYYPSPDRIDEAIEPVYIEVENPQKTLWPISGDKDVRFVEPGAIIELDAADVILASQVGLLPEPRLEMYAFDLLVRHDIAVPPWIGEKMPKLPGQPPPANTLDQLLDEANKTQFERVLLAPVDLKAVKSVFVEEGKIGRATRGLSAQDVEFVVSSEGLENIALVVPLSRDWDNNILVGIEVKAMPAPNRLGGVSAMINAPTFVLPAEVKSLGQARDWVAAKFMVPPENVGSLGESYFTHTGVTPQRVYPFFVASARGADRGPGSKGMTLASLSRLLGRLWFTQRDQNNLGAMFVKSMARVTMFYMSSEHGMSAERSLRTMKNRDVELSVEKEAVETRHAGYAAPSRVLGQRGAAPADAGIVAAALEKPQAEGWKAEEKSQGQSLAEQNSRVQKIIEGLMMPRIGKRLTQSYAQALNIRESLHGITLPVAPDFDKSVNALAERLKKSKEEENKPPELVPEPPSPNRK